MHLILEHWYNNRRKISDTCAISPSIDSNAQMSLSRISFYSHVFPPFVESVHFKMGALRETIYALLYSAGKSNVFDSGIFCDRRYYYGIRVSLGYCTRELKTKFGWFHETVLGEKLDEAMKVVKLDL